MASQRRLGAVLGYANIIVKNLVNLIYTPMLLSFVGQGDYGVYQASNSFIFSLSLLTFGFSEAYVRFYTRAKASGSEGGVARLNGLYISLYLIVSFVVLVIGIVLSSHVNYFYSNSFTAVQVELAGSLMVIMTVNISLTLFSTVFDAYILAHERFQYQQTRQMLTSLATPVIALFLLNLGLGAIGVALAQLLVTIGLLLLNARYSISVLGMSFRFRGFDKALFLSIASFSAWIFGNQICELINQSVPNILLGVLTSAVTVSIFAVSIQIRSVFISLSTVMSNVFIPKINQIVATSDDNNELVRLMTRVGRYQMLLFCWVYCGFVLLGRFFVSKWAGEGFLDAYYLICAMTLPLGVPLCQNTGIEIQRAKNRHKARSVVYLCMALLNVAFTWVASPYLGYWAPAVAYIASISLGNGLFMNWYYHARIGLDMGYFWRRNLPVALVSAGVLAVCMGLVGLAPVSSWGLFVFWGAVYTTLFALAMWRFVLDGDERASIAAKVSFLKREA